MARQGRYRGRNDQDYVADPISGSVVSKTDVPATERLLLALIASRPVGGSLSETGRHRQECDMVESIVNAHQRAYRDVLPS